MRVVLKSSYLLGAILMGVLVCPAPPPRRPFFHHSRAGR